MSQSEPPKSYRKLLTQFIRIYQSEPCLWNVKSEEYRSRTKRDIAYNKLLEVYKLIDPNANKEVVVRKINILRTTYRREKKKLKKNQCSGTGIYEPRLWYYRLFDFLNEQDSPNTSLTSSNIKLEKLQEPNDFTVIHSDINVDSTNERITPQISTPRSLYCRQPRQNLSSKNIEGIDKSNKSSKTEDRFDLFGRYVAMKMRDIKDHKQIILAEKMINDTLFYAEMRQLTSAYSVCPKENESLEHSSPNVEEKSTETTYSSTENNFSIPIESEVDVKEFQIESAGDPLNEDSNNSIESLVSN